MSDAPETTEAIGAKLLRAFRACPPIDPDRERTPEEIERGREAFRVLERALARTPELPPVDPGLPTRLRARLSALLEAAEQEHEESHLLGDSTVVPTERHERLMGFAQRTADDLDRGKL